ncbi:MAG: DsbA family oxidoreductase [Donghicola eburneus]|nr:DsbA family oxidoreductase [Donghicola eburneus]MCI5041045.1 DsbA family oxidoreductase [Donghicola eburneus]
MTDASPTTVQIDIVSDIVCPWCVIGFRQLVKALEANRLKANLRWHPFELNPDMPADGQNLRDHLVAKYGITPAQSQENRARMIELGADLGFDFQFNEDMRMWNTFQAHQLLDWADGQSAQTALKQAMFKAHFTDNLNMSDPDVLVQVAESVGLDATEAREVLDSGRHADAVRNKQQFWTSRGVTGVPAMIFAQKYLVTGAQGADNYGQILQRCLAEAA